MKPTRGVLATGALCAGYSAFSLLLFLSGAPARAVWLPIEPSAYYLAQAVFVWPLFALLTVVFTATVRATANPSALGTFRESYDALAQAYAWPLLLCFVIPDVVAFLIVGQAGLAKAMRYYAWIAPLAIVALSARYARTRFGVSTGRAALASVAALFAQGALGATVLR